jgi:hypothetical protein
VPWVWAIPRECLSSLGPGNPSRVYQFLGLGNPSSPFIAIATTKPKHAMHTNFKFASSDPCQGSQQQSLAKYVGVTANVMRVAVTGRDAHATMAIFCFPAGMRAAF